MVMMICVLAVGPVASEAPSLRRARRLRDEGDLAGARDELRGLVNMKPGRSQYAVDLMELLLTLDDWSGACELGTASCRRHPRSAVLHGLRGRALFRSGALEASAEACERALELDRDSYHALVCEAQLRLARGDAAGVEPLLERAMRKEPLRNEPLLLLANHFQATGHHHMAAGMMERYLAMPPVTPSDALMHQAFPGMISLVRALGLATPFAVDVLASRAVAPLIRNGETMMVDLFINGLGPYRMIFDTGGSFLIMLDDEVARDAGLQRIDALTAMGVAGTAEAYTVIIPSITVGILSAHTVPAAVYDMSSVAARLGRPIHGVFGAGLLQDMVVTLDFRSDTVTFEPATERRRQPDPAVRPGAGPESGNLELPFLLFGDAKICLPVWIGARRIWAVLDTGASSELFSARFMREQRLVEDADGTMMELAGVGDSPASAKVFMGKGLSVAIGGRTFDLPYTVGVPFLDETLSPVLGCEISMLVGNTLLQKAARLRIDYPNRILDVEF